MATSSPVDLDLPLLRDESVPTVNLGQSLLRQVSSNLLGISDVPAEPSGRPRLIRGVTARQLQRDQAQANVDHFLNGSTPLIVVSAVAAALMFVVGLYGVYAYIKVVWASLKYADVSCDEPLSSYWLLILGVSIFFTLLRQSKLLHICFSEVRATAISTHATDLTSTLIQYTFLQLLWSSKTCAKTNPVLYYSVEHLVYWQILYLFIMLGLLGTVALALRRLTMLGFFGPEGRGCPDQVKAMDHIDLTSPELIDIEDSRPRECVICMQDLSERVGKAVVKTPCNHFYHETCLESWCARHVTCPICRQSFDPAEETLNV